MNLAAAVFSIVVLFNPASQSADLLSLPYYKLLAESFKENNFTMETVWKDFFNSTHCERNTAACLTGMSAGLASINNQNVILHKSEKLNKNDTVVTKLGNFIVVDRNETQISLTVSKKQRDDIDFQKRVAQKKIWNTLAIYQNEIAAFQTFISTQTQKNPLFSALFAATFMTAYKSTNDPFASFVPYDLYKKLASLPDQTQLNIGFISTPIKGRLLVIKVDLESPAFWGDLRVMDEIQLINGLPVEKLDAKDMEKILQKKVFTLKVMRNKVPHTVVLKISEQKTKKVKYSVIQWKSQNILKIVLKTFEADTNLCVDLSKKISSYRSRYSLNGVILDLRDNGGGSVSFATCLASIFLGPSKLFMSEVYIKQNQTKPTLEHGILAN